MVQSSDLVRISTVQSMDFSGQSSDLAEDLSKSSSGSEGSFILFVWVSVWCLDRLPFTQSLSSNCPTVTADGVSEISSQNTVRSECRSVAKICIRFHLNFLFFSSSSYEILTFLGGNPWISLVNPWINPQIVWISLNPWIYRIIWGL